MREVRIEKIVLSCGGTAEKLEKSLRLLKALTGRKPSTIQSKRRIPNFGVRPGLEVGCKLTLRGKAGEEMLKRLLQAENNEVREKSVKENHFSFGIREYIEIPGVEYQRDIGLLGLNVTVDFARTGRRVEFRKIKRSKMNKKQYVTREEIKDYMVKHFGTKFLEVKAKQ